LRTINERINQLEARLAQVHREPISDVPAVVQFDGIWLSMQTQQDDIHEDSRKRKRGKRVVVLVALGLWTDGSGKRHILDWEVADKEEQASWERLVQRLWERGVKLETGLQAIVRDGSEGLKQALDYVYGSTLVQQRCIFHKLCNVSTKCVGLDREGKKSFMEQAAAVYHATSAPEAQARLAAFGEQWPTTQPQAVATFEREAGANHPLLFVGGHGARSGADDLPVGTHQPGVAAQVSASRLFQQPQGSRGSSATDRRALPCHRA
jgi:putative transposase